MSPFNFIQSHVFGQIVYPHDPEAVAEVTRRANETSQFPLSLVVITASCVVLLAGVALIIRRTRKQRKH